MLPGFFVGFIFVAKFTKPARNSALTQHIWFQPPWDINIWSSKLVKLVANSPIEFYSVPVSWSVHVSQHWRAYLLVTVRTVNLTLVTGCGCVHGLILLNDSRLQCYPGDVPPLLPAAMSRYAAARRQSPLSRGRDIQWSAHPEGRTESEGYVLTPRLRCVFTG